MRCTHKRKTPPQNQKTKRKQGKKNWEIITTPLCMYVCMYVFMYVWPWPIISLSSVSLQTAKQPPFLSLPFLFPPCISRRGKKLFGLWAVHVSEWAHLWRHQTHIEISIASHVLSFFSFYFSTYICMYVCMYCMYASLLSHLLSLLLLCGGPLPSCLLSLHIMYVCV